MCDIWKDNKNLKQLSEDDVKGLLAGFKKLETKQVLMSGGEALLNPKFFRLCEILRKENMRITLLSTGLTLKSNVQQIIKFVDDIIVSLDGNEEVHNRIRNIPDAFKKLKEGIQAIKVAKPGFRITGRSVIHRLNFSVWPQLIDSAKEIGLDQISFLPADVSSHEFNREILWSSERQHEIMPELAELEPLQKVIDSIVTNYKTDFEGGYIAESPKKIQMIYDYYGAFYHLNLFPYKKCNAPWVSAVVEADGTVKPCFFHTPSGNIHNNSLDKILNSDDAINFRKNLDTGTNEICKKCVCYLNLPPGMNPAVN
jgi:MoaA/NifB/PqqE/SkfB family radical SAM enzyme